MKHGIRLMKCTWVYYPPNPKSNIVHAYEKDAKRQVQTCLFQNKKKDLEMQQLSALIV